MSSASQVLQHVIDAITPASAAAAAIAGDKLRAANTLVLETLAAALAGAQHTAAPRAARRLIVVAAGDHGCGDPGIAMGSDHPTVIAARAIADGSAALCSIARPTPIVLVDAGAREPSHMPSIAIPLGRGPSRNLLREPAQTVVDAMLGLEAGIALSLSLSEQAPSSAPLSASQSVPLSASQSVPLSVPLSASQSAPRSSSQSVPPSASQSAPRSSSQSVPQSVPLSASQSAPRSSSQSVPASASQSAPRSSSQSVPLSASKSAPPSAPESSVRPQLDVLALGAIGVGSEVASAALLGAVLGASVSLGEPDADAELAMERGVALRGASGIELLAHFGGPETAVLAGLILGAASMNVAVVLDGYATGAAALVAAVLAPAVTGYLIAAHRGSFTMPAIVEHLGLHPAFEGGLGHGEGTGAAMVLPLLDQVAANWRE